MALEELERLADDAVIYRSVGELVIKTTKEESVSKLKDRKKPSLSQASVYLQAGRKTYCSLQTASGADPAGSWAQSTIILIFVYTYRI